MTTLPYMASVRTRDPDALCYTTQNMWACYEFKIPKPVKIPAHHTRKRIQPQIADKVIALMRLINQEAQDWSTIYTQEVLDYFGGWKPYNFARGKGEIAFELYNYETFGFSLLLAEILAGKSAYSVLRNDGGISRSDILKIRNDYDTVSKLARSSSRLINFATYSGAKMWCDADDGATICEIDNTRSIPRRLNREDGTLYYPYGARYGHKIIVSTWVNEDGGLSVRWAKSYPIYSDPAAFDLVASS